MSCILLFIESFEQKREDLAALLKLRKLEKLNGIPGLKIKRDNKIREVKETKDSVKNNVTLKEKNWVDLTKKNSCRRWQRL